MCTAFVMGSYAATSPFVKSESLVVVLYIEAPFSSDILRTDDGVSKDIE